MGPVGREPVLEVDGGLLGCTIPKCSLLRLRSVTALPEVLLNFIIMINSVDILEFEASQDPPSPKRFEEWKEVWGRCTLLEKGFWDMAMDLS